MEGNGRVRQQHASMSARQLAARLRKLKLARKKRHLRLREEHGRRNALSPVQRAQVLAKTARRCHVCGGKINGNWQADHVLAHSSGGAHSADNYLPAHALCNNYRWDYGAKEFQLILKLGVWVANEIRHGSAIGVAIAEGFTKKELRRERRASTVPIVT